MFKKRRKTDPQLLIAIGVLIASFSALFVYMKQASIMNEQTNILLQQTKANSWPYIDIRVQVANRDGLTESYVIGVDNKGNGPAIIEGVRMQFNDIEVKDWQELFLVANKPDSISTASGRASILGRVLSANEQIRMLATNNSGLADWIYSNSDSITIKICYKSVFNDYWITEQNGLGSRTLTYSKDKCIFSTSNHLEE